MNYPTNDYTTQLRTYRPPFDPDSPKAKSQRTLISWILTGIFAVLIGGLVVLFTGNTPTTSHVLKSPAVVKAVAKPKPVAVAQPETAAQVAASLNCHEFTDLGPSTIGGSIDSGSCYINNDKYAINTFASHSAMVAWLHQAEQLGVVPKWETPTSVTYPSVD